MGDPKKQHKKFNRPRQIFSKIRIEKEKAILKAYGLKNRREIWKAETSINKIRNQAKSLILDPQAQEVFFTRLRKMGLIKGKISIDDVLALTKENLLERRLQTIVYKKGLAKTIKEARQLITHRKIRIGDKFVNIPGYIVSTDEEKNITIARKEKNKKPDGLEIKEEKTEKAEKSKEKQ